MNEKSLERKLREVIKQKDGLALKVWSVSFTGLPDRLVLMPEGRVYFAEIKTTGKKPKPRQDYVHGLLQKLGFYVAVIDSKAALDDFLRKVCQDNEV